MTPRTTCFYLAIYRLYTNMSTYEQESFQYKPESG